MRRLSNMIILKKLLGEVPTTYNGGGKSGGGATAAPTSMMTTTSIGDSLSGKTPTFEDTTASESGVDKKKMGTRGLRIPLAAEESTTKEPSASTTGIQL